MLTCHGKHQLMGVFVTKILSAMFCLIGIQFQSVAAPMTPSKFRQDCALTSKKFKENLPKGYTDVWCADDSRKDLGEMGPDVMHAMTVAVFLEQRKDRRDAAMNLLEKYECTDLDQCKEFYQLLDWGIKSTTLDKFSKSLAARAEILRQNASVKIEIYK
jgi:hypothetical protein